MFHNSELTLRAASRNDFLLAITTAMLLAVFAALLSPMPASLLVIAVAFLSLHYCCLRWFEKRESNSRLIKINSGGELLLEDRYTGINTGALIGPQWSIRHIAVLRCSVENRIIYLVILKISQRPEQFRRLTVWLRHNSRNEGSQRP